MSLTASVPALYRKRLIPSETVCLKDDTIVRMEGGVIVTEWKTLKPRTDFAAGRSCYFLDRGFKVSRFFDSDGGLLFHYCDIIETSRDEAENAYIFLDLLVDVIVYENGLVKVLDLGEVADALDEGLISAETAKKALRLADELLTIIYAGRFKELTAFLDRGN